MRPVVHRVRFTPTHVGKTRTVCLWVWNSSVHPHTRGEDCSCNLYYSITYGSPPRTWGRLILNNQWKTRKWFTPTHVGKTISGSNAESVFAVHPHARGEDTRQAVAALGVLWFTPTHVGKTFCFWCYIIAYIGSPPRTWGRLVVYHDSFFRKWFTPTHVGKTAFAAATNPSNMVHPHARGEDANFSIATAHHFGSPPRTWGRHFHYPLFMRTLLAECLLCLLSSCYFLRVG